MIEIRLWMLQGVMCMFEDGDIIELRILQTIESEERWWKSEEIAEKLVLSKATVQKYLTSLKNKIEHYSPEEVYLQTSTSKGIYFYRAPGFNLQILYTEILKELLIYSILDSFLYNENIPITQISLNTYVSVASIRRKYKVINTYFADLGIMIKKDQLLGDERQIRWFFSKFYWEIYRGVEWPFQLIPRMFVENMLATIENFFDIEMIPEVKEEMMYWLTVNGLRHIKGYRVPLDEEISKYALNNPLFEPFIQILGQIFPSEARKVDEGGPGEMQYLFFLVNALPVLEKHPEYSQMIYQAHQKGNTIMYQATKEWLVNYEEQFGAMIDPQQRERLEKKLLRIHCYSYLYTMGQDIYQQSSYVDEVITYHPVFFAKIDALYKQLLPKYQQVMKNEAYLKEAYALLSIEEFEVEKFEHTIRVALSFSEGLVYENVIMNKLNGYFTGKYKIEFVPHNEEKEIVITNLPSAYQEEAVAVVSVNTWLSARDFQNIEKTLAKLLPQK